MSNVCRDPWHDNNEPVDGPCPKCGEGNQAEARAQLDDHLTARDQHRLACGTCGKRLRDHIEGVTGHAFVRTFAPARAPLDGGVDGVDCDWDERGKCRCRAAIPASLDVDRLYDALAHWYGGADDGESFRLVPMSSDGGVMPTGDLHPFAAAIGREYAALEEPKP